MAGLSLGCGDRKATEASWCIATFQTSLWSFLHAADNPGCSMGEQSKLLGTMWGALGDEDKAPYQVGGVDMLGSTAD